MSKALDLENALPAIKSWVLGLLNLKAPLASPALTGTPTAPTASYGTDSTQVATTAFVQDAIDGIEGVSPSSTTPAMDGTATPGEETTYARGDHVHPKDTSKLDKSGGTITGDLSVGGTLSLSLASLTPTHDTEAAAKGYVDSVIPSVPTAYTSTPAMDGTGSAGSSNSWARGDHVHPKDTSKLDKSGGTMTGALTLSGAPTSNLHAATKKYVDDGLAGKAASATTLSGYGITDAYTKTQTDSAISTAISDLGTLYEYKGSVATYADLPASPSAGDVYNVVAAYGDYPAGTNWAWNGSAWDALGGAFSIEFATATEVTAVLNA